MALSASIFRLYASLSMLKCSKDYFFFCCLYCFLPRLIFSPDLVILHNLLGIFTINLVCSHCHLIPKLGESLEGGHCVHDTIFLEEESNELAKKYEFLLFLLLRYMARHLVVKD